jgi:hypothetical protein
MNMGIMTKRRYLQSMYWNRETGSGLRPWLELGQLTLACKRNSSPGTRPI